MLTVKRALKFAAGLVGAGGALGVGTLALAWVGARRPRLETVSLPLMSRAVEDAAPPLPPAPRPRATRGRAVAQHSLPLRAHQNLNSLVGPRCAGEIRILHLADLHLTSARRWEIRALQRLAALDYDLLVLTGDNFAAPSGLEALLEALEPHARTGRPGAFVYGSNDYYAGRFKLPLHYLFPALKTPPPSERDLPTSAFTAWLEAQGWLNLCNRSGQVSLSLPAASGRAKVALLGVDDPHLQLDEVPAPPADWERADLRLALTHAPYTRVLDRYAQLGAQVILAGHTHGGQLCLPGGRSLVNNCDLPLPYSHGLHRWKGAWLYVSRGLGTSRHFPLRLNCAPEATLLRVRVR